MQVGTRVSGVRILRDLTGSDENFDVVDHDTRLVQNAGRLVNRALPPPGR